MPKEAVFTLKIEPARRDTLMAEAAASHRPASQIVRELMRGFVERERNARDCNVFPTRKIELASAPLQADRGRSTEDLEASLKIRHEAALRTAEA